MKPDEYLKAVLEDQSLAQDSPERKKLSAIKTEVDELLKVSFSEGNPSIRYGGSIAKGTVIRENYDLDMICYFPHDDDSAGENLKDIYYNVKKSLELKYVVTEKTSALRLKGKSQEEYQVDFHVDVVPGKFIDEDKNDVFIYQSGVDKERLKTNLQKHIEYIRDSGYTDAIKLLKLWKARRLIKVKTFVIELLAIKILSDNPDVTALEEQLTLFWQTLRDTGAQVCIEDPANPSGNDLSKIFDSTVKPALCSHASTTLESIRVLGWETIFGQINDTTDQDKAAVVAAAYKNGTTRTKPWSTLK